MKAPSFNKIIFSLIIAFGLAACGEQASEEKNKGNSVNTETVTTGSGLQYRVMTEGTGASPTTQDMVVVHYTGKLTDGTVFDSSVARGEPARFGVTQVIAGWTEALQMMKEGSKWELTIPSDLAYGDQDRPKIPGGSTLIFEVELLEVLNEEELMNRWFEAQKAYLDINAGREGVQVTENGLQYKILSEGTGASPSSAASVTVHYAGRLINGHEFDSSYKRGAPISFDVTGVIPGWTQALQMMKAGDKWELTIPSDLAYGDSGTGPIPPKATLVFDVELISFKESESADE